MHFLINTIQGLPGPRWRKSKCNITCSIPFIFTTFCLFLMLIDLFIQTLENLLGKMYVEGIFMSKSQNIALNTQTNLPLYGHLQWVILYIWSLYVHLFYSFVYDLLFLLLVSTGSLYEHHNLKETKMEKKHHG